MGEISILNQEGLYLETLALPFISTLECHHRKHGSECVCKERFSFFFSQKIKPTENKTSPFNTLVMKELPKRELYESESDI